MKEIYQNKIPREVQISDINANNSYDNQILNTEHTEIQ